MTFRIKKGDHGVLSLSNVGSANIVVSYWGEWQEFAICCISSMFLEIDMYFDSRIQSSI